MKISYFAFCQPLKQPGVANKISQMISCLKELGYDGSSYFSNTNRPRDRFIYYKKLVLTKADIVLVRVDSMGNTFIFFCMLWLRLKKTKIILDVPTPMFNAVFEILERPISLFGRMSRVFLLFIQLPWSWWPAHRILQYSVESPLFMLGNRKKSLLIGNAIDVDSISQRKQLSIWPAPVFKVIGVANLAFWHGYDRVLHGISQWLKKSNSCKTPFTVLFSIIGEGPELKRLKAISNELDLDSHVIYTGPLFGNELSEYLEDTHVAVGAIGIHRKKMSVAGELKLREYCSRSIPFIYSSDDPDFQSENPDFALKIPNDDSPIDLQKIIEWYELITQDMELSCRMRRYASTYLDWKTKIPVILDGLA